MTETSIGLHVDVRHNHSSIGFAPILHVRDFHNMDHVVKLSVSLIQSRSIVVQHEEFLELEDDNRETTIVEVLIDLEVSGSIPIGIKFLYIFLDFSM